MICKWNVRRKYATYRNLLRGSVDLGLRVAPTNAKSDGK